MSPVHTTTTKQVNRPTPIAIPASMLIPLNIPANTAVKTKPAITTPSPASYAISPARERSM